MFQDRRRRALGVAFAAIAAAFAASPAAAADGYPSRPIRLVLGSAAGSGSDVVSRILSARMGEHLGQTVVVDNRPGAAGLIGAEIVANAPADGYTIWVATLTQHLSTTLRNKYLLNRSFEPIALLATTPFMIVASATIPVKSTEELIAYAKARPGKLLFGSSGTAGSLHICVELFQSMAGLKMVHVPYKGSAMAISQLMSGEIQLSCPPVAAITPFLKDPKVRVLGVTTREETPLAPGYPPISRAVPGYAFPGWYGAFVPPKTPKAVVDKLHAALAATLKAPDIRKTLLKVGVEPALTTPAEFRDFLDRESARMSKVLKEANISAGRK